MSSNLIYSPSAARVLNTIPPNEHTAGDRTPYCYLIGWGKQNLWYYGRRTAEGCHPREFWITYKTSSIGEIRRCGTHSVESCVKTYGDPDIIQIRSVFFNADDCINWENRLLKKINASSNRLFLNKTNGDTRFDGTNQVIVRDTNDNMFKIYKDSEEYLSGVYVSVAKGVHWYKDVNNLDGACIFARTDDPRVLSGELVGSSYGYGVYLDNQGVKHRVPVDDERVLSGVFTTINRGMANYKNIVTGETMYTSVDDPRVLLGEYVGLAKNFVAVTDLDGNIFSISKDDPRYTSGEVIPYVRNKVSCFDANSNKIYVSTDDPRYVSGELKSVLVGTKLYIDLNGKVYRLQDSDALIQMKELVLFDTKKYRKQLSEREEFLELLCLARSKQISLCASSRWTIDLAPIWEFVKNSPNGSRYGTRKGKQSSEEVKQRNENIERLRNRPEVLYLKDIAKQKNIKLSPYWEWKNDIAEFRDIILNGPHNVSYAKSRKTKVSSEI